METNDRESRQQYEEKVHDSYEQATQEGLSGDQTKEHIKKSIKLLASSRINSPLGEEEYFYKNADRAFEEMEKRLKGQERTERRTLQKARKIAEDLARAPWKETLEATAMEQFLQEMEEDKDGDLDKKCEDQAKEIFKTILATAPEEQAPMEKVPRRTPTQHEPQDKHE